jgi:hypothetical protein
LGRKEGAEARDGTEEEDVVADVVTEDNGGTGKGTFEDALVRVAFEKEASGGPGRAHRSQGREGEGDGLSRWDAEGAGQN